MCGGVHDVDRILLCDGCDREFHLYCLNPPLEQVPEGDWYCPDCVAAAVPSLNGAHIAAPPAAAAQPDTPAAASTGTGAGTDTAAGAGPAAGAGSAASAGAAEELLQADPALVAFSERPLAPRAWGDALVGRRVFVLTTCVVGPPVLWRAGRVLYYNRLNGTFQVAFDAVLGASEQEARVAGVPVRAVEWLPLRGRRMDVCGEVVWARVKGHPWHPGQVIVPQGPLDDVTAAEVARGMFAVRFFSDDSKVLLKRAAAEPFWQRLQKRMTARAGKVRAVRALFAAAVLC